MASHDVRLSQGTPPATAEKPPITAANSFMRDKRRGIIESIQSATGRTLLCYVAGNEAEIDEEDVRYLQELILPVASGDSIDLLLHSDGGVPTTSEKLVHMLWAVIEGRVASTPVGELRVIVPDRARSAATLLALGANSIVMSDTSELGPIDPQAPMRDSDGNLNWHSVFDYLDAYESAAQYLRQNP